MTFRLGLARGSADPLTDSLLEAISMAAASIDVYPAWVRSVTDEPGCDAVLVVGAPRSYAWFFEAPPATARISWFGEPLPRANAALTPGLELGSNSSSGARGSALRVARRVGRPLRNLSLPGRLGAWREAAGIEHERLANLDMAAWCSELGARIVVTSRDRGAALTMAGIPSSVVPFGYHPHDAGPLTAPDSDRDIAVAIIGTGLHAERLRRGRILAGLRPGLQRLGSVVEIEGRWGAERDAVLRRARIVVDIQRVPGNFAGLRWVLASAAGAAYVTEPLDDPAPLRAGVDHLEASSDTLVDEVARLLGDEQRRRSIVDEAQGLMRGDLAMHRSLERVLAR